MYGYAKQREGIMEATIDRLPRFGRPFVASLIWSFCSARLRFVRSALDRVLHGGAR